MALVALLVVVARTEQKASAQKSDDKQTWVEIEFERLNSADTKDLDEIDAAIKAKMGDDPDEDDFVVAYHHVEWNEFEKQRNRQANPSPANECWKIYMEACESADRVEDAPIYPFNEFHNGTLPKANSDAFLDATAEVAGLIAKTEKLGTPTAPAPENWKFEPDIKRSPLARVAVYRVVELFNVGRDQDAKRELQALFRVVSNQEPTPVVFSHIVTLLQWSVILRAVLQAQSIDKENLGTALAMTSLKNASMKHYIDSSYNDYHRCNVAAVENEEDKEALKEARKFLEYNPTDGRYRTSSQIIRKKIKEDSKLKKSTAKLHNWQAKNPGDFLDSEYFDKLWDATDEKTLFANAHDIAELYALVAAIKIRIAWLEGKRDEAFKTEAKRIATEAKFDIAFTDTGFDLFFLRDHIKRKENPERSALTVNTTAWPKK